MLPAVKFFQGVVATKVGHELVDLEFRINEWLEVNTQENPELKVVDRKMSTTTRGADIFCTIALFYEVHGEKE